MCRGSPAALTNEMKRLPFWCRDGDPVSIMTLGQPGARLGWLVASFFRLARSSSMLAASVRRTPKRFECLRSVLFRRN